MEPRNDDDLLDVREVSDPIAGRTIPYVEHHGTAICVCEASDGRVLFVSQARPVLGVTTLELPGGRIERGESAAAAAARETMEETGYLPRDLVVVGRVYSSVGLTNEIVHIYRGRAPTVNPENDASGNAVWLEPQEALERLEADMGPADLKTVYALRKCLNDA